MRARALLVAILFAGLASTGQTCVGLMLIESPPSGTVFTTAQTVTLQGVTSWPTSDVDRVEFFLDGQLRCTDVVAPYSCSWPITAADDGDHVWTARTVLFTGDLLESQAVELGVAIGGGTPGEPQLVGLIPSAGTARDVLVDAGNDLAYVASDEFGLSIFDISDPSAPMGIGSPIPSFTGRDVAVAGSLAVATGSDGLRVIDVSNPSQPETIGFVEGSTSGVTIAGQFAFVRLGTRLATVDLRIPESPSIVSEIYLPGGNQVKVVGSMAYVTAGAAMQVFDVSNPFAPQSRGSVNIPNGSRELAVQGNHVYVGNLYGIHSVDVSNPDSPVVVGSVSGGSSDLAISGGRLYSAAQSACHIYDLSNPALPLLLGTGEGFGVQGIDASGNHAFLASPSSDPITGQGGLYVVDVADPASATVLAQVPPAVMNQGIAASGSLAVSTSMDGLSVVDVSNPHLPETIGFLEGNMSGAAMAGQFAFVRLGTRLATVDLRTPESPSIVSEIYLPGGNQVKVVGSLAYVTAGGTMRIFDVSNPFAPQSRGSVNIPNGAGDLAIEGNHAFVGNLYGVHSVDVSNPDSPVVVGFVSGGTSDLAVSDGRLYAAAQSVFRVYDVTNPATPILRGTGDGFGATSVGAIGDLVFVGSTLEGVAVYDVSDPTAPQLVVRVQVPGAAASIAQANGLVYVGDGAATLDIFDTGL